MPRVETNQLKFIIPMPTGTSYLDVGQICSLVNRKMIRQGNEYFISNIELVTDGDFQCNVQILPPTWVLANSWVKSFKMWQESQNQVLDVEGRDILGKYADFKIFYDGTHAISGVANNLLPTGFLTTGASAEYDWDPTTYQIPNDPVSGTTTEYTIHALGPSQPGSVGMISGYAASRARPQQNDPNVVDSASPEDWMTQLFDTGENLEEIRQDIEDDNDSPPYLVGAPGSQLEYYPGGSLQAVSGVSFTQDVLITRAGTSLAMDSTGPFSAPCGLIRFDCAVGAVEPTSSFIFLELSPGPMRGILARSMQEVNG